jgi:gliding motility-associated-like protein
VQNSSPKLIDIDHDGDLDIVLGKYDAVWYLENTGTSINPVFEPHNDLDPKNPFKALLLGSPVPNFYDVDGDGDQDLISGNEFGQFDYFENTNPAPITLLATTLNFAQQSTPILLDASISVSDTDNDLISSAIISIANFKVGQEVLSFTPQGGITGSFNSTTGVLTLTGKAAISVYSAALKTISYQYTGPNPTSSGRLASGNSSAAITLSRSITVRVFDQDFTNPVAKVMALEISFPDPIPGAIEIFNGISPNGDGLNDFFEIRNIAALEPNNKVSIYTRWGDKVFEVENYDNDQKRFIGLNDNGNELTSGVYFYKVKFASGKADVTGYLTIKR